MYHNLKGFSLAGMYYYFEQLKEREENTGLFEDIELFEGGEFFEQEIEAIDPEIVEAEIMERYGEFITYRQIPLRFKKVLELFFKKNYKNFAKMQIALQMDFNPIYNYDRFETWTDDHEGNSVRVDSTGYQDNRTITPSGTESLTTTQNGTEKTTDTPRVGRTITESTTSDGTSTKSVTGYNGSSWVNAEKVVSSNPTIQRQEGTPTGTNETELSFIGRSTQTQTTFSNRETTDNVVHEYLSGEDATNNESNDSHSGHMYGNIGVTTSTAMIKEVLELYDFDLYKFIADKFAHELLIMVY